jgi:excisionase family DNA binding protein
MSDRNLGLPTDRYYSLKEVAYALHLHEQTVRRLLKEGTLSAIWVAGKYRFPPGTLAPESLDRLKTRRVVAQPSGHRRGRAQRSRRGKRRAR